MEDINYFDVVADEDFAEVKHLQHGDGTVVRDGVALEHILGGSHLPGQPPLAEGGIDAQHVREVPWLAAAAAC